jgi:NTP pyrophosphatase (non-canonical NTP hydrolase)
MNKHLSDIREMAKFIHSMSVAPDYIRNQIDRMIDRMIDQEHEEVYAMKRAEMLEEMGISEAELERLNHEAEQRYWMQFCAFDNYQHQARETAIYEDVEYLEYALVEELGELAGKIAKSKRGDCELDATACLDELGDILWSLAMLAYEYTVTNVYFPLDFTKPLMGDLDLKYHFREMVMFINNLLQNIERYDKIGQDTMMNILCNWAALCEYFGSDALAVAQANREKLASRAERGVIEGDGDER